MLLAAKPDAPAQFEGAGEPALQANPFFKPEEAEEGHTPASVAFRYRKWTLPGGIKVVGRTTVHAAQRKVGLPPKFLSVWSLHEWDPKLSGAPDYRKTFDTQRGNLIATEIKNNSAKLAKFTISSLLAGTDAMKVAFVTRNTRADNEHHLVVGTASFPPGQFALQLALQPANMWGILKWLVDLVRKHAKNLQAAEEASDDEFMTKFVLMRDPNASKLYLYAVPNDAFDEENEGAEGAADLGWEQNA